MQAKRIRHFVFKSHRIIGLVVGIVLAIVGLTGSILVFYPEMADFMTHQAIGTIASQGEPLSLDAILDKVKPLIATQPDVNIQDISPHGYHHLYQSEVNPIAVWTADNDDHWTELLLHPYTGAVLSQRPWDGSFFDWIFRIHYQLLAGDWGMYFVGVVGLLAAVLCITGMMLWPGWRKLAAGFKIKWDAKPKRLNFDIHKVVGIVAAVFLFMATLTGFLWNFWDWSEPLTYKVFLSEKPADPVSPVILGRSPISISEAIQRANQVLPNGEIASVVIPSKPEGAFEVRKKLPQDANYWGEHSVYLDQYSGDVIRIATSGTRSLAEKFLNAESTVHYGTFAGIPSRLLYVLVGLSPTVLLISGSIMWQLRRRKKSHVTG